MKSISTKHFDYNKETNTFVQELSSLPEDFRLSYNFELISHKTGKAIEFSFWRTDGHNDVSGDVSGWWYRVHSASGNMKELASLLDMKILIIND